MARILIEWLYDDIDTGEDEYDYRHYVEGARVYFDEVLVIDLSPKAALLRGRHWPSNKVFSAIFARLNIVFNDADHGISTWPASPDSQPVRVEWLKSHHECETCGSSFALGRGYGWGGKRPLS